MTKTFFILNLSFYSFIADPEKNHYNRLKLLSVISLLKKILKKSSFFSQPFYHPWNTKINRQHHLSVISTTVSVIQQSKLHYWCIHCTANNALWAILVLNECV